MRKTKIICTIGPACRNEETLTDMIRAGMNVARLNFSHGTHAEHLETIDMLKRVREKLNVPLAIMLDTKGPEYRIKTFENGKIDLKEDDKESSVEINPDIISDDDDENNIETEYEEKFRKQGIKINYLEAIK